MSNYKITSDRNIKLEYEGKSLNVPKLGFIKYKILLKELDTVVQEILGSLTDPEKLKKEAKVDERKKVLVNMILDLINKNIEAIISLIDKAIPELDYDIIAEKFGANDIITALLAIIEANYLNEVIEDGKKLVLPAIMEALIGTLKKQGQKKQDQKVT